MVNVGGIKQWQPKCVRANTWSQRDANSTCQQLGFLSGETSDAMASCGTNCTEETNMTSVCNARGLSLAAVQCKLSVRLVGGSNPSEGRVEVYYQNQWGTICADSRWSIHEAQVICKSLGYWYALSGMMSNDLRPGATISPTLLRNVFCEGDETGLDGCSYEPYRSYGGTGMSTDYMYTDPIYSCEYNRMYANVRCLDHLEVRLAGGNNVYEGRVEVRYDNQWGTVCDDDWDLQDGQVVCRMLGLGDAEEVFMGGHFGSGSGQIWLDQVECSAQDQNLATCLFEGFGVHDCTHKEDAGVRCGAGSNVTQVRLVDGPNTIEGRVEVGRNNVWGTVCDDNWGIEEASTFCRMLNFGGAVMAVPAAAYGEGDGYVMLDEVDCPVNATHIDQCQHDGWNQNDCSHKEDAGVVCLPLHLTGSFEVGGVVTSAVEVYNGRTWQPVCQNNVDNTTAHAICTWLGYWSGYTIGVSQSDPVQNGIHKCITDTLSADLANCLLQLNLPLCPRGEASITCQTSIPTTTTVTTPTTSQATVTQTSTEAVQASKPTKPSKTDETTVKPGANPLGRSSTQDKSSGSSSTVIVGAVMGVFLLILIAGFLIFIYFKYARNKPDEQSNNNEPEVSDYKTLEEEDSASCYNSGATLPDSEEPLPHIGTVSSPADTSDSTV